MKRRFTILTAAFALLAILAIPMGMRGQTTKTYKLTIDASDFNTTSYAANNNEKTSDAVNISDATDTYEVSWTSNQVMKNGNNMQWQKSNGYIYNSTDLGTITNVTVTSSAGTFTTYYGTTAQPSSGTTVGGGFFQTKVGTATGTTSKLEVTFEITEGGSQPVATTLTIDDSDISNTDVYTGTAAGSLSATVKENTNNTVISGAAVTWSSSNTNIATIDNSGAVTLVAAGTTTITASYAGESGIYGSSSATYELTVTSSEPYVQPTTIEITPNYEFWGKDGQFSGDTYSELEGSKDNVTLNWTKGSGSTYANSTAMRFYKDNNLTFTAPEGYEIISIALTVSGSYSDLTFSPTGYDNTTTTWTGSSQTVTMSRPSNASSYATISKFIITLGLPSTDPSITANGVTIPYDATSGSFNYTINNPVQGGYLTVDENESWISDPMADNGVVIFNTETNPNTVSREGIIRMRYLYDGEILTHNVTITQTAAPVIYSSIPALFEAATNTETSVLVTFNNWVVSGVSTNGNNVFVTDNNGNGFVIYGTDMNNDYAVGDILSGTAVSCTLKKYNGFAELINLNAEDLTITSGGTVSTANVAMADLAGVNTGALVHYEGLICSVNNNKYYLTDGTTTLQVYNAIYAFEALEDGETYNITGVYQQYNNTKEILPRSAADIEEVVVVEPSVTVTPNTISAPFAGAEGTLALTYENIEEFISFDYYFCDANGNQLEDTDPDYPGDWIYAEINDENDAYTLSYIIDANDGAARTAYMKVYTFDDNLEEVYAIVTVNQAQYVVDYATLPFEYDGNGTGDLPNGFTVSGLGTYNSSPAMKFDGTGDYAILKFNERPGTLTFDIKGNAFSGSTFTVQISEDGVTYTDLETYTELGDTQHESFDNLGENVRYIKWVYTYKSSGNVALGNIVLAEYVAPALVASITVNPDEVNVDATPAAGEDFIEGTLDLTWENLEITDFFEDFAIQYYDAEGEELADDPNWIMVDLATQDPNIGEGYLVSYMIEENEGTEARMAYFKVYAMDDETNLVYSNLVTISQAAPVVPPTPSNWVLTDLADLTADDVFVIVGDNGDTYAMPVDGGGQNGAPAAVAVTVVEGTLSAEPAANLQWNISITEDGYTFYPNGESETWLYCTNSNNGVRVGTNTNNVFVLDNESGYLKNVATSRYIGIYDSQDWRCYTNTTGNIANQTFAFYKKVAAATETYTLDITGYEAGSDGGYYLIASPVTVNPANVEGMTDGEYDLYSFDQAEADEWRNYKQNTFNLEPGKGYLYAKQATEPDEVFHFELTGTAYNGDPIVLKKTDGGDFPGWNLVGNPYTETAYIDRDFYVMQSDGSEIITGEGNEIAAMQGFFVIAANDNEELEISTTAPNTTGEKVIMNVTSNRGNVIDRAIVRFGEGRQLPKFQLRENSTKISFAKDNSEYAVVRSEAEGEMPVSFKAEKNGTYTFSVNTENVEMEYLHLIDNMTGADIDLIANPSYSFEAKVTDYASRFRLVFSANSSINEQNANNFAFFNGNDWTINNEGEATLQVVDMTGRVLSTETVNGNATTKVNAATGVYMLRLINGNNIKTQKVVVK